MAKKGSSLGFEGWRFLIVKVASAGFHLAHLLLLCGPGASLDFSQLAFVLAVSNDLLAALTLLLLSPEKL